MINPLFLVFLIPIAGYIILKSENVNFDKKKVIAGFFIILLVAITPSFSFEPAFADNEIRQVIKIAGLYPADVASADFTIDPPLLNIDKAFIIYTVRHTGEDDESDTFRSIEILDVNSIRLKGEDTATGNNAVEFVAYIIEYEGTSELDVQHIQESLSATAGNQSFTMGSINTTNSMIVSNGLHVNTSASATGNNDFNRISIVNSTTWQVNIDTAPSVPRGQIVSVIDWNQTDISVQSGLFTMVNPSNTGELIGGIDFTTIDPTRTMFLFTYTSDGSSSEENDDLMLSGSLTDGGDIRFSREDDDSELLVAWQLIEFPADFIKIKHFNSTLLATELSIDVTVPEIQDFDKTMAMSHGGSPFGYSTGTGDNADEIAGGIDRSQSTLQVISNTEVQISREDSSGFTEIGWQMIEFLEPDLAENAQGTNTLRQIVKINGEYTGSPEEVFTISPPLLDVSKAVLFMSISDASLDTADVSERLKRFGILNTTTMKIHGSNDPTSSNTPMNFTAYIVEFDASSPIFVQRDQVQYANGINAEELIMHMSPVNQSGTHIQYNAWTSTGGDDTIGQEEFARVRIINDTTWGYEVELPSNDEESVAVVNIIDWNQNDIFVQSGQASLTGTTLSVSPTTDVIRNQTILLVSHMTSNSEFEDEPDDSALFAHLDGSSPPDMVFERVDSADPALLINWQLITFPSDFANIQHLIHNQTAGTGNDTASITSVGIFNNSIAIGTSMSPMGFSNGKATKSDTDSFGEAHGKITLENATTVRFERGLSTGSWELGYQVMEFLTGQVFDQDVSDVVTAVDLSQNKNVTKLATDTIASSDTVNTNAVFVIELSDTGDVLDVTSLNITKLNIDTVTALDETNFNISMGLLDTATILDLVDTGVFRSVELLDTTNVNDELQFEITKALTDLSTVLDDPDKNIEKTIADIITIIDQTNTGVITQILELDTVQANDEVRLEIIKAIIDVVANSDELNFSLTKLLADTASVTDLIDSNTDLGENPTDLITANDLVILDVTRQLSDVASAFDNLDLVPTKVFIDTTSVSDTVASSKDSDVTETDPVVTQDNVIIDVTKLIQDISTIQDDVVLLRILDIAINDTVTVNDPSIFFTIATNQTAGGSGSASTGGGVPSFERLVGLSILSELFNVVPKDNVPSDFVISTFGMMNTAVEISNIEPDQQFNSWFQFSTFPNTLRFATEVDSSRTINDPARFKNTALESFVLTVPLISCEGLDPFVTPVPCIDPLVYEIPIIFSITKGGVEFKEKHIVTVDATERIPCDVICEIVDFITQNYWWLAGILIVFMMMFFLRGAITKRGARTVRRVNKNRFTSFDANTPKRKFKRGKGR